MKKKKHVAPKTYNEEERLIWELIMYRDFVAFCSEDWSMIEDDFMEEGFFGIDGKKSSDKATWSLTYPNLAAYKKDWLHQSTQFNKEEFAEDPLNFLFENVYLSRIDILGETAFVHKVFDGTLEVKNKPNLNLDWLSLFVLRKVNNQWKIQSFTGYLPRT
ncbi:hypothetical protein MWU59_12225 [Flavobacteriaceae bacterium F08102]|nr:hypothetical protein [Flavobacteriaceae bacterium F08102]